MFYRSACYSVATYELYKLYHYSAIVKGNYDLDDEPASQETSERVNRWAKKMGVKNPIIVWETTQKYGTGAWGSDLSGCCANIRLEKDCENGGVAHEVIHIRENHFAKEVVGRAIVLSSAIFARTPLGCCASTTAMLLAFPTLRALSERDADYQSVDYLSEEDLAEVSYFHYKNYLENPHTERSLFDQLIHFVPHPIHIKRAQFFEEELFKRERTLPLEVEVKSVADAPPFLGYLCDESNREIRKVIHNSIHRNHWVNLRKIVYQPNGQVELWQNESELLYKFDLPNAGDDAFDALKAIEWILAKQRSDLEETYHILREENW